MSDPGGSNPAPEGENRELTDGEAIDEAAGRKDGDDVVVDRVISTTPIEETAPPGTHLVNIPTTPVSVAKTRRGLAWALIGTLIALTAVGAIGWLCYGDDVARMQTFAIVFSPIVTLVGTVLGFYFSSTRE